MIIDSTTIRLFSDILKGVGRNPKNDGKEKRAKGSYANRCGSVGSKVRKDNRSQSVRQELSKPNTSPNT